MSDSDKSLDKLKLNSEIFQIRIQESLESGEFTIPNGLTREQRKQFVSDRIKKFSELISQIEI